VCVWCVCVCVCVSGRGGQVAGGVGASGREGGGQVARGAGSGRGGGVIRGHPRVPVRQAEDGEAVLCVPYERTYSIVREHIL